MKRDRTDPHAPPTKTQDDLRYERDRVAWNLPRPAKPVSLESEREARRQHPDAEVPPAA